MPKKPKVLLDAAISILKKTITDPEQQKAAIEAFKKNIIEDVKKDGPPKTEMRDVFLRTQESPKGEAIAWHLQMPADKNPADILRLFHEAVYAYNATPKGQKTPYTEMGDALENFSRKFLGEHNIKIKNREGGYLVVFDNQIPGTEALRKKESD